MPADAVIRIEELRVRAESQLRTGRRAETERQRQVRLKAADLPRIVHELDVQRIELELQNEELRATQLALIQKGDYYARLFEHAPVGYVCLDQSMVIHRLNAAAEALIGSPTASVVGRAFASFLAPESIELFFAHHRVATRTAESATCELLLESASGVPVRARVVSLAAPDSFDEPDRFRMVMIRASADAPQSPEGLSAALVRRDAELQRLHLTVRTLADELAETRERLEKSVSANVDQLIMPLLWQLRARTGPAEAATLNAIEAALGDLSSGFASELASSERAMTTREIQVCDLIRRGMGSKEVALALGLSPQSVEVHRKNIRRKLGLTRSGGNLLGRLQELAKKPSAPSGG